MRFLLSVFLSVFLLSLSVFGQTEKPQTIIVPTGSLGNISEVRKKILEKTLESALDDHFAIVPKDLFEEAQEKAFEELDYEECTEEQCIMMIKEILQVDNAFQLVLMEEDGDTHISLTWNDLDQRRVEEEYCEGCKTKDLRKNISGLVEKLIGLKKDVVVKEEPPKKVEPVVVETPKVVQKVVQEPVVQKIEKDKTKGMFVSVGQSGTILTSPDGTSWTQRTSGTSNNLHEVTYGNGLFVTVGWDRTILTSSNGTSWTQRTFGRHGMSKFFNGVTYGNGLFVTVGEEGIILTSLDGTRWIEGNSGTSETLYGVTYGNGLFVIVGVDGTILTSFDGTSWTERNSRISNDLRNVIYGNGMFVTVGRRGTILTSSNGTTWTERTSGTPYNLIGVTYGNGLFVTVGYKGTILTSPDGTSWMTQRTYRTSKWLYGVTSSK